MDEMLASMWNSLSLSENESITLNFNEFQLIRPRIAIVGKLTMKKNASTVDVDRFLKGLWKTENTMETTLLGENLYLFSLPDQATKDRILRMKPWNYHGAVFLLDSPHDHGGPTDFNQHLVPFWVQIHGLPLRAMNRLVGTQIGSLIGEVVEVYCNGDGVALGRCTRVRVLIDVREPLMRWQC